MNGDSGITVLVRGWRTCWRLLICLKDAIVHFLFDDGLVMAGHLTFVGVLSLFPFLIFVFAVAGFIGQTEIGTYFVAFIFENMPAEVGTALQAPILEVVQDTRGDLLTIGIVLAIWTASSGLEATRLAVNRAYETDTRRAFWRRRLESILLTVVAAACIMAAMFILIIVPVAWTAAQEYLPVLADWRTKMNVVRYAISGTLIFLAICGLFFVLPSAKLRVRWVAPGALLVVVGWMGAATGFSFYLQNFGSYSVTYGSLAGVVVAMLFFYIMASIFVLGAEFNAAIARADGGLPGRSLGARTVRDSPPEG